MKSKALLTFMILAIAFGLASGGVLQSLDKELSSVVKKSESYLVTVNGAGEWRNKIATGIIFSPDGYLLTSSMVYDSEEFTIIFKNGEKLTAEKIGKDDYTGLAVLRIQSEKEFSKPKIGKASELEKDSWIMAVGNSFGDPATVNIGYFRGETSEGFIKLGIEVDPGSSGGAVLNTSSEIIGVLVARETINDAPMPSIKSSYSKTLGFLNSATGSKDYAIAIPIENAIDIAEEIIKSGTVERGYLGISQKDLSKDYLGDFNIECGVMVVDVVDDSPADKAGLEDMDIITSAGSQKICNTAELFRTIRSFKPGRKIELSVIRGDENLKIDVELGSARENLFFGGWKMQNPLRKFELADNIIPSFNNDLQEEISRLNDEIESLKNELDTLKKNLSK